MEKIKKKINLFEKFDENILEIEKNMNKNLENLSKNWINWKKTDFLIWLKLIQQGKFEIFVKNFQILFEDDDDENEENEEKMQQPNGWKKNFFFRNSNFSDFENLKKNFFL